MLRLIIFLLAVVALAAGMSWLADRPGNLVINWEGYLVETSVFRAIVLLALLIGVVMLAWSLFRQVWNTPAALGNMMSKRRQKRGLEALSSGMIAIGAGDRGTATRYAIQARKSLPNEPMTHLLRAQAAQLAGDKVTARRIFEAMLATPDTEPLGLRGLFLEAEREGEKEAAKQFAERAVRLNAGLEWAVNALFDLQCKDGDWAGALETLSTARSQGHIESASAKRRRAVLLTAQAMEVEEHNPEKSLELALEAHKLAVDLIPAAALAGRILAARGNTPRATKVIRQTWAKSPHPDLAVAYAFARLGDSPRDRLERIKQLANTNPYSAESPIAVATAAVEAREWQEARNALEPLIEDRLTQRVCTLMARVEGGQHEDRGKVREWLARALNAPRDPAWTADGIVSEQWAPVSPVSGALDAFQWRVPVENLQKSEGEVLAQKLEELVALGAPRDVAIEAGGAGHAAATGATAAAASASVDHDKVVDAEEHVEEVAASSKHEEKAKDAATSGEDGADKSAPSKAGDKPAPPREANGGTKPATAAEDTTRALVPAGTREVAAASSDKSQDGDAEPLKPAEGGAKKRESKEKDADQDAGTVSAAARVRTDDLPAKADPTIYVPPRAPDDPGPEGAEPGDTRPPTPLRPYRLQS